MPYMNSVTIMGRLTADPELRHVPSGDSVATFTVAVNSTRKDKKERRADFFACDVWGGWAQNLAKTARKGSMVVIEGRLVLDRWIDSKTNAARERVKVLARRVFHVAVQYDSSIPPPGEEEEDPQEEGSEAVFSAERGSVIAPQS